MIRCAQPAHSPSFSGIAVTPTSAAQPAIRGVPPRKFPHPIARRWLLGMGLAALTALAVPAHAGLRVFPMGTQRGQMVFTNPPQVQLNGKTELLGPGTRVHDAQSNRLVFASTLKGQTYVINYVRDGAGTIREIWILTPEEIQQKLPPSQADLNRLRLQSQQNSVPLSN